MNAPQITQAMQAMQEAGFFRIMQPARYGGFEMDPEVFFKVQMTLRKPRPRFGNM